MQAACSSLDKLNTQLERITTESILKDPSDVPVSGRTDFNESPVSLGIASRFEDADTPLVE